MDARLGAILVDTDSVCSDGWPPDNLARRFHFSRLMPVGEWPLAQQEMADFVRHHRGQNALLADVHILALTFGRELAAH